MNKKLSIIVPVYNVEDYLPTCIESLINQDYSNYEIILVDDGSTDSSMKICKSYEKKYPTLIKVYSKENGGQSTARNYGISKVDADYIFFVDSDDYIKENCLNAIMKKLKANDILVFNQIEVNKDKQTIIKTFDDSILDLQKRFITSTPGPCNKIIKASILKENNITFPDKIFYEDLAIIPIIGLFTKKIVFTNDAYYYYVQRNGSTMHQRKYNQKLEDVFVALENLDINFSGKYRDELEYIYIWHLLKNASLRFLDFDKTDILEKINKLIKEKYPKWYKNIYFKKFDVKRKVMCLLFMMKQYTLIKKLRSKGSETR